MQQGVTMGFFGKIKDNLKHGGVKINLAAPDHIGKGESQIDIQTTIEATDNPQRVKSVVATLETHYFADSNNATPENSVMARQEHAEPFDITPGQPLNLNFQLQLPSSTNPVVNTAAKLFNHLGSQQYRHYICVVADVDGISIDPKAQQSVTIEGYEQGFQIDLG